MYIYVLDKHGQPLMPTSRCGKVRKLLKQHKAKVTQRCPFTIQLLYKTMEVVAKDNPNLIYWASYSLPFIPITRQELQAR